MFICIYSEEDCFTLTNKECLKIYKIRYKPIQKYLFMISQRYRCILKTLFALITSAGIKS